MQPDPDLFAKVAVPMDDGSWISARTAHVAEAIRDYDSRLDVKWVPADRRRKDEDAIIVTERTPDGREVVVLSVRDESGFDERVLERIYAADGTRGDVLARMEAHNRAVRELDRKAWEDARAAAQDVMASAVRSPLHTWRHNGKTFQ